MPKEAAPMPLGRSPARSGHQQPYSQGHQQQAYQHLQQYHHLSRPPGFDYYTAPQPYADPPSGAQATVSVRDAALKMSAKFDRATYPAPQSFKMTAPFDHRSPTSQPQTSVHHVTTHDRTTHSTMAGYNRSSQSGGAAHFEQKIASYQPALPYDRFSKKKLATHASEKTYSSLRVDKKIPQSSSYVAPSTSYERLTKVSVASPMEVVDKSSQNLSYERHKSHRASDYDRRHRQTTDPPDRTEVYDRPYDTLATSAYDRLSAPPAPPVVSSYDRQPLSYERPTSVSATYERRAVFDRAYEAAAYERRLFPPTSAFSSINHSYYTANVSSTLVPTEEHSFQNLDGAKVAPSGDSEPAGSELELASFEPDLASMDSATNLLLHDNLHSNTQSSTSLPIPETFSSLDSSLMRKIDEDSKISKNLKKSYVRRDCKFCDYPKICEDCKICDDYSSAEDSMSSDDSRCPDEPNVRNDCNTQNKLNSEEDKTAIPDTEMSLTTSKAPQTHVKFSRPENRIIGIQEASQNLDPLLSSSHFNSPDLFQITNGLSLLHSQFAEQHEERGIRKDHRFEHPDFDGSVPKKAIQKQNSGYSRPIQVQFSKILDIPKRGVSLNNGTKSVPAGNTGITKSDKIRPAISDDLASSSSSNTSFYDSFAVELDSGSCSGVVKPGSKIESSQVNGHRVADNCTCIFHWWPKRLHRAEKVGGTKDYDRQTINNDVGKAEGDGKLRIISAVDVTKDGDRQTMKSAVYITEDDDMLRSNSAFGVTEQDGRQRSNSAFGLTEDDGRRRSNSAVGVTEDVGRWKTKSAVGVTEDVGRRQTKSAVGVTEDVGRWKTKSAVGVTEDDDGWRTNSADGVTEDDGRQRINSAVGITDDDGRWRTNTAVGVTEDDDRLKTKSVVGVTEDDGRQGSNCAFGVTEDDGRQRSNSAVGVTEDDGRQGLNSALGVTEDDGWRRSNSAFCVTEDDGRQRSNSAVAVTEDDDRCKTNSAVGVTEDDGCQGIISAPPVTNKHSNIQEVDSGLSSFGDVQQASNSCRNQTSPVSSVHFQQPSRVSAPPNDPDPSNTQSKSTVELALPNSVVFSKNKWRTQHKPTNTNWSNAAVQNFTSSKTQNCHRLSSSSFACSPRLAAIPVIRYLTSCSASHYPYPSYSDSHLQYSRSQERPTSDDFETKDVTTSSVYPAKPRMSLLTSPEYLSSLSRRSHQMEETSRGGQPSVIVPPSRSPSTVTTPRKRLREGAKQEPLPLLTLDTAPPQSSTTDSEKPSIYMPTVEPISPTSPPDAAGDEGGDAGSGAPKTSAKDNLLLDIARVDREINKIEHHIFNLKRKQVELEQKAKKSIETEPSDEAIEAPLPQHFSLSHKVYSENRRRAKEAHAAFSHLGPPVDLPLYHQPSDTDVYQDNRRRHLLFKGRLIAHLRRRRREKRLGEIKMTEDYGKRTEIWNRLVEKMESSPERKRRDAENRELFEKTFPKIRKEREDRERFLRVGSRVKSDADLEEIMDNLHEQEMEVKKMRDYAAVPPMLLSAECRRCVYVNTNGFIEDFSTEYKDRRLVNVWTDPEKAIFREKYLTYPKNFGAVAAFLDKKSVSDCVQYYYLSKKTENYKRLLKKSGQKSKSGRNKNKAAAPPVDTSLISGLPAPTIAPRFQRDYKPDVPSSLTSAVTVCAPAQSVEAVIPPVELEPPALPPEPPGQPVASNGSPPAPQPKLPPPDAAPQPRPAAVLPPTLKPLVHPFPDIPIVVIDDSDDSNSSSHFPHLRK